jgi:hypothetical protein
MKNMNKSNSKGKNVNKRRASSVGASARASSVGASARAPRAKAKSKNKSGRMNKGEKTNLK